MNLRPPDLLPTILFCLISLGPCAALHGDEVQAGPVVAADMLVQGKAGQPIIDLKLAEVEVVQDAERQQVTVFRPLGPPGHYEVQYRPRSGQPNAMTIRVLRSGSQVRGIAGPALQPLVLRAPTVLEAQLESLLELRGDASELNPRVALLHYERNATGRHHTVAVEVAAGELQFAAQQGVPMGWLQVFARFKDAAGRVRERFAFDRPMVASRTDVVPNVTVARVDVPAFERLVWTGHLHLATGLYTLEVLVLDANSGRVATRRLTADVGPASPGPELSSVTVLQPREFLHLASPVADDPLLVGQEPVMPTLEPELPAGGNGQVRFYASLYPDPKLAEPLALRLELRRGEEFLGSVPLELPLPGPGGETRYVGLLATRTFRPAAYALRLVVSQGAATSSAETTFTLVAAAP